MLILKNYQKKTLETLEKFLQRAKIQSPQAAFEHVVQECPSDTLPQRYTSLWGLDDVPYVCLRLPTGGGKTLLAAHTVQVVTDAYLERDLPCVLWLVPTNTIRQQTVQALRKDGHPYREVLKEAFGLSNVQVVDIDNVAMLRPKDIFEKACIIVGTIQTLRVEDTTSRSIYSSNEAFEPHFATLPSTNEGLDRGEDGKVLYSFVNMLHQIRPLVIADEAHKMKTSLSNEVMRRINPACVVEFTATPVASNVLYRVFPSELKTEEMVKLPFNLAEHTTWEQAVLEAVGTRTKLAEMATQDAAYIRPIVLFQAEKKNQTCTVTVLKDFLMENGIAESEIAIATGEQRELDNIDLFDKTCPIKYVITVEALKEGWDCSFAYVFCSVANIKSATDVEQLLGRVMRMPYAKARTQAALNMAYAHVIAPTFGEAAEGMYDRMLNMGFDGREAAHNIAGYGAKQGTLGDFSNTPLGKFAEPKAVQPLEITLKKAPDFSTIPEVDMEGISVEKRDSGYVVTSKHIMPEAVEERVLAVVKKGQEGAVQRSVALHNQSVRAAAPKAPSEQGKGFAVPRLMVEVWGSLEWAEPELFLQAINWSPLEFVKIGETPIDAKLFNYDPKSKEFIFDLDGEALTWKASEAQSQYTLYALPQTWTDTQLVRWLDNKCRQDDIDQPAMLEFCRRSVAGLLEIEGLDLATLYRAKDALAAVIKNRVVILRKEAQKKGFQQLLFAPSARVEVSFDEAFRFPEWGYAENISPYTGSYMFSKHYYPNPRDLKSSGEEFRCAQAIDAHPKVKMWVRNVDRQYGSFFLPTSTDKFYPDFVAMLDDGRIALVEYKGAHLLSSDDTKEKRNIGELWASKSGGKGVFLLVSEGGEGMGFDVLMKNI